MIEVNSQPQFVRTAQKCVPYQMQKGAAHDIYDYVTSAGNDKWAFDKFKSILMTNHKIRTMQDLDEEKTRYLLERWTGKRMKFFKGEVLVTK